MEPFKSVTAVALPLVRANVDTDTIIPSREIRSVTKTGLADGLFAGWRYSGTDGRAPEPGFVMNQPGFAGARILLGGDNFGCGSSREHAVWALKEYGFRAIIAPRFAPIFFNNCVRNGVLPVVLAGAAIAKLALAVQADPAQTPVTVDLERRTVSAPGTGSFAFELDAGIREQLLEGLDPIGLALRRKPDIEAFLARDRYERPWIYL
ncbi:MAG: 3-isopropylmalate dehydratase small subunit [Steroidobacteraceae bacterium]